MKTEEMLFQMMEKIAKGASKAREPRIMFGDVTGVNPLKVQIGQGEDSYEIDEDFMVVGELCRRKVLKVPTNDNPKHFHTENDMLTNVQGMSPAGPVIFSPAGDELPSPTIPDPDDPSKQIPNPNFPTSPTILSLNHKHTIEPALPEILLRRGVKKGDKVIIIRFEGGSIHYVIEPVRGTLNDENQMDDSGNVQDNDEEQL